MDDRIILREGREADHDALGEVMYDAVRNGPSRYSPEQRVAWVPEPRRGPDWAARLQPQTIICAEFERRIIGFMTLEAPDYVDFAFIRPAWQGAGVFRGLHDAIESRARADRQARLHVHASLMAQPAFSAMGYQILEAETVEIRGISFERYAMEKRLAP